ncbi:MAG: 50S ribosomal protein L35 [Fibrobacteraceae bacterium]|jgi:large subunit ribosomal protein L35|nr:50S ribosomal protein L35 [Fibrobacteraceae bacterium]MBO5950190.1 50S ribosomal protein L35 [Fibrobacteraceae bacterium]MBQ5611218.1 50S ribosomal protein L35 [Fibrobacteraceae bacterium]MEE0877346.1 50S ribosomal protein L35 [Fibrobacteraceae bacterium]MEE1067178.1 50S ribosomal protein L35 [Fibrobacteraceae bacterium]
MPKMKTHSGSKKRFRVTGSGHVKFKRAGMRHILTKMSTKRKRNLRKAGAIKKCDMYHVKRLLVLA